MMFSDTADIISDSAVIGGVYIIFVFVFLVAPSLLFSTHYSRRLVAFIQLQYMNY
jgi:hypothetical protein